MWGIKISTVGTGAILAALCASSLSASPIFGTFNIAGTINVTLNTITWVSNDSPFPPDTATVGPGPTGSFVGLGGTTISIQNLSRTTEPVGSPGFGDQPFIAFNAAPTIPTLDINFIFQGIYPNTDCATLPPTVGQVCTPGPPNSPFNFVNNPPAAPAGPQATATFVFTGETADHLSAWRANFTSQFDVPYQTVLAAFGPGGSGVVSNTYSATVTVTPIPPVPEPDAMALTGGGLGLVLLSIFLSRRSSKRCL